MPLSWRQLASLLGPPGPMAPLGLQLSWPWAGEKRTLLRAPQPLTINRLDAVLSGGSNASLSLLLRHGADVTAPGTALSSGEMTVSSTTTGAMFSGFGAAVIPADHWLWLEVTAVSGSPAGLLVSLVLQPS